MKWPTWKSFDLSKAIPEGQFVDFFNQTESGWNLQKRENIPIFPTLSIAWEELFGLVAQPNQLPITVLIDKVQNEGVSPLEMWKFRYDAYQEASFPCSSSNCHTSPYSIWGLFFKKCLLFCPLWRWTVSFPNHLSLFKCLTSGCIPPFADHPFCVTCPDRLLPTMEIPKIAAFAIPKKIFSQPLEFGDLSPLCQSETCFQTCGGSREGVRPLR